MFFNGILLITSILSVIFGVRWIFDYMEEDDRKDPDDEDIHIFLQWGFGITSIFICMLSICGLLSTKLEPPLFNFRCHIAVLLVISL